MARTEWVDYLGRNMYVCTQHVCMIHTSYKYNGTHRGIMDLYEGKYVDGPWSVIRASILMHHLTLNPKTLEAPFDPKPLDAALLAFGQVHCTCIPATTIRARNLVFICLIRIFMDLYELSLSISLSLSVVHLKQASEPSCIYKHIHTHLWAS
jgi:hypothetical protein